MRAFFWAVGLAMCFSGAAFADAASGCDQDKDQDLSIRACTLAIEGRVKGYSKRIAFYNRGHAYIAKGEYGRAIADYD